MIRMLIVVALTGSVAYIAWRMVSHYRAATGNVAQRLLASAKDSETILVQYAALVWSWVIAASDVLGEIINSQEVKALFTDWKPEYYAAMVAIIAIITILARVNRAPQTRQGMLVIPPDEGEEHKVVGS